MASWKQVTRSFETIKRELGSPEIELITPSEFKERTGASLGYFLGRANLDGDKLITVKRNRPLGEIKNTLYHECLHILFRSRPHWWIECAAEKLSGAGVRGKYSSRYGHSPADLPSRVKLLQMIRGKA